MLKIFPDSQAANDHIGVSAADSVAPVGELRWELLRSRWRLPSPIENPCPRVRLMQLLDATRPGQATLLCAPPGYGKTQAICGWLYDTADAGKVAWLTAEARDNHPDRFVGLLAAGLLTPQQCSQHVQDPFHSQLSPSDRLTITLRAWKTVDSPVNYLVLDNLEQFDTDVIALVVQLLHEAPVALTVVMASSSSRLLTSSSRQLADRVRVLGPDELALSFDETRDWFEPLRRLGRVCPRTVERLHLQSGGWIGPLGLIRNALDTSQVTSGEIGTVSEVDRFFKESVLAPFAARQGCPLSWLAEPDELSEAHLEQMEWRIEGVAVDSQLEWLASEGLPLTPITPGRLRWRLNPLFREWLLTKGADGRRERMQRLGVWLFDAGDVVGAVSCLVRHMPPNDIQQLLEQQAERLLGSLDLRGLLELFSTNDTPTSPALKLIYAWCLALSGRCKAAVAVVGNIQAELPALLRARYGLLMAFVARAQGDSEKALSLVEQVLALDESTVTTSARHVALLQRGALLASRYRFQEARDANRAALRITRASLDGAAEMLCIYEQARIESASGYLGRAVSLLQAGIALTAGSNVNSSRMVQSRLQEEIAWLFWHRGEREAALNQVVSAIEAGIKTKDISVLKGYVLRSRIARAERDWDAAFHWLDEAERHLQRWQVEEIVYLPVVSLCQAMIWMDRNSPDEAENCLLRMDENASAVATELFPWLPGMAEVVRTRLCLHKNDIAGALKRLTRLQEHHQFLPPLAGQALYIPLLQSVCYDRHGRSEQALMALRQAVDLASTERVVAPFFELQEELRSLLGSLSVSGVQRDFLALLQQQLGCKTTVARGASAVPIEPVSERERGVLELIALGLSNQDIADRLHISLHTVKTHARKINAKLGVRSRTQAIVRARELGLL